MAIKNYDYKKFEIRFKHLKISYFHLKGGYLGGREKNGKKMARRFKALDLLLSLLSSILGILKSVFV